MIAVVHTQCYENYGDVNNPHWKPKGGQEIKVTEIPEGLTKEDLFNFADKAFSLEDPYYQEFVVVVSFEENDYLSDFERSQLEYEGHIEFPEKVLTFQEMLELGN